jgi:hypothetical protein
VPGSVGTTSCLPHLRDVVHLSVHDVAQPPRPRPKDHGFVVFSGHRRPPALPCPPRRTIKPAPIASTHSASATAPCPCSIKPALLSASSSPALCPSLVELVAPNATSRPPVGRFARCPWPRGVTPCRPPFSPRKRVRATTVPRSASPSGPCARSPGLLSQPRRDAKLCIPNCAPAPARWPPLRRAKPQRRHAPTSSPPRLYLCYLDDGSSSIAIASRLPCCSATAAAPHRNSSRPPVSSPQAQAFTFLRFYKPFLTIPCHELQAVASTSTSPAFFLSVEAATS